MAQFTTGEAVTLELPVARIPTRVAAFLIDLVVQAVLLVALILLVGSIAPVGIDWTWFTTTLFVLTIGVRVGYPVISETLLRGRTLGKLAVGLRVVRSDGGSIDFRHAMIRSLSGTIVDFGVFGGFGVAALVTSMCSPRARRIGDVLADTVVVYGTAPLPVAAFASPPPWLAGWAAYLNTSAIPDDLALAIRAYLTRFHEFAPETQHQLGIRLVLAACGRLGVVVPGPFPPMQILGAVTAERQRREFITRVQSM